MKINAEERKSRFTLTLLFSGVVLLVLIINTILTGLLIYYLVYHGQLQLGDAELKAGSLVLNLLLWSIVIGAVLAALASRFPLKPINKILNAINRLAAGDYTARLSFKGPISKTPPVREITNSFNLMATELQHTEELRSDFVNNFSHEFKTPIVSIAGFAKLLKRGNLPEARQKEYLDAIEEESMRLAQMATNVLNLTKVENQSILTDVRRFNLSEQLRTSMLLLESKWTKKHIELLLPSEEYYMNGNEELMKQVWINLFDNAIKFSQDYGTVEAQIRLDGGCFHVLVSNFGELIPEESMGKIFNKFYQVDESHAAEGNGVGLAVVKKIVDLHGGTVSALCRDGKTTFTVTLPA